MKSLKAKTEDEIKFLNEQFEKDPTWSRKTVQLCKKALNMRTDQVYKWGYDRKQALKKKNGNSPGRNSDHKISKFRMLKQNLDLNDLVSKI